MQLFFSWSFSGLFQASLGPFYDLDNRTTLHKQCVRTSELYSIVVSTLPDVS